MALTGELGTGKTVFARGVAVGLGCAGRDVRSPSFTLINAYRGRVPLYHMDFYRLERESDLEDLGLEDFLYGDGVSVIEWADKFPDTVPSRCISVLILMGKGNRREIRILGQGSRAREVIERYAHRPEIRRYISRES